MQNPHERVERSSLASLIRGGVADGWAANAEIAGPHYRRSRLAEPSAGTAYFSITAVYMDSMATSGANAASVFRGDYQAHPYGELNMVIPLTPGAQLAGPLGWRGTGWTSPAPGSHHYPEARDGAVIALFFLPAGRISYDIEPAAVLASPVKVRREDVLEPIDENTNPVRQVAAVRDHDRHR